MAGAMRKMGIYLGLVEDDVPRGYGRYDARPSDELEHDRRARAFTEQGVSHAMIRAIDVDGDEHIGRLEFLIYVLQATGKVDAADIAQVNSMFDRLDCDGSGTIDPADIDMDECVVQGWGDTDEARDPDR